MRSAVALFAFNRPESVSRVLDAIRGARPERLFLVCDGARADKSGEAARVAEVRAVLQHIDWPCTVERNYSDVNMGCRARIASGIDWVLQRVPEAIFLEDDTLPDASFFPYCEELLARYRDDSRVLTISGLNLLGRGDRFGASYWFSLHPRIWGWATWRRAWQGYDVEMRDWPAMRETPAWTERTPDEQQGWGPLFDAVKAGRIDTWDAQLTLHAWRTGGLTAISSTNLVTNIGFGAGATNTGESHYEIPPVCAAQIPLVHPRVVARDEELDAEWVQREHGSAAGPARRAWRRAANWLRAR